MRSQPPSAVLCAQMALTAGISCHIACAWLLVQRSRSDAAPIHMRSQRYEGTNKEWDMQAAVTSVVTHPTDGLWVQKEGLFKSVEKGSMTIQSVTRV